MDDKLSEIVQIELLKLREKTANKRLLFFCIICFIGGFILAYSLFS
jgi:hypothetical protein